MDHAQLVSILIPCYQHAKLLPEAIESVIAQSHRQWQIIVVNDGSTDGTQQVAQDYISRYSGSIRLLNQPNRGQAEARRAGLELASGDYLVMLDADDRLAPSMLEQCIEALIANPDAGAAVTNTWLQSENFRSLMNQAHPSVWPHILEQNPYGSLAGVMVRMQAARAVGGLTFPGPSGCEDWDLWVRLARCQYPFAPVPKPLAYYCQTTENFSRRPLAMLRSAIAVLDACRIIDPRLTAAPHPPAPPLDAAQYARLRNGRLMHAFGQSCAGGASHAQCSEILQFLAGEALDLAYSRTQFLWGCHAALRGLQEPAPQCIAPDAAAVLVCNALKHAGLTRQADAAAQFVRAILLNPRRKAPLRDRIRRRLRRLF